MHGGQGGLAKKARIIKPPDDLRRRAINSTRGLNLDLSREDLARIETAVHRSRDRFVIQVADRLKALRARHVDAVADPAQRPPYLNQLRDESLAMKGLGGTFGYPLVTAIAASLNDFVLKRTIANEGQLEAIRLHIDALYVTLAEQAAKLRPETEGELLASLKVLCEKYG